jgi:DNA repair photolyase
VRWENLTVDEDERMRLAGYRDPAVVRRFDAPEALETRFYDVRARSILNRVPEASKMPFRWTINPYRGCTHACLYCQAGDTAILTGDGRDKPLSDLDVGDAVYGTTRDGRDRRYVRTVVLDKWIVVKPAYRVTLEDGTELIASGAHRYLTDRGWKHVVNASPSAPDRPHLTTNDQLVGTGAFSAQPEASEAYRRGYVTGASAPGIANTDPAITRRRSIEGEMVKTFAGLRVACIEPLGRAMPLYDITTGTGDFIANGVVSHNCFARPTHRYLDFDAGRDFEKEIVVKVNAPERLRVELARPSWRGEHVALGTNTDPYQWVEGRYKLMRGIWEAFRDAANPCSVLTKSPLLLRDLDLMREINERTSFSAALSVPTLDEKAWRATEPHTPNPRARLEAIGELTRAGIKTGVLIAPLMPGINDSPEQVGRIVELATEAGASFVSGIALHLRGEVRELFFAWLREQRPDLIERYEDLYHRGAYAPIAERRRLARLVDGPAEVAADRMRGSPPGRMRGVQRDRRPSPPPVLTDPQERLF